MKKIILSFLFIPLCLFSCAKAVYARKFSYLSHVITYLDEAKKEDFPLQKVYQNEDELINAIKDRLISDGTAFKREDKKIYFDDEAYNRGEEYTDDEGKVIYSIYRVNRHNIKEDEIRQLCFFAQIGTIYHFYQRLEYYSLRRFLIFDESNAFKKIDGTTYYLELKDKEIKYEKDILSIDLDAKFFAKKGVNISNTLHLNIALTYQ